jgi:hypothetical protein
MVTTINSRKRLLSLSNKRKKGGNKKQRSKKKKSKRTRTKKKIRGGSKRTLTRKNVSRGKNFKYNGKNGKSALNNRKKTTSEIRKQDKFSKRSGVIKLSLMFGNLHGQYFLPKDGTVLLDNLGAGLRDDFMYYIFANYANLSPADIYSENVIINKIIEAMENNYNWINILEGLELMQERYKTFYQTFDSPSCSQGTDDEKKKIALAGKFLTDLSETHNEVLKEWQEHGGFHCPGAGGPLHTVNTQFTEGNAEYLKEHSCALQEQAISMTDKDVGANSKSWFGSIMNSVSHFYTTCKDLLGNKTFDFTTLIPSTFHLASTAMAQEKTLEWNIQNQKFNPAMCSRQIKELNRRKQELYALTYGKENGDDNNQSISIFTTYTEKIQEAFQSGFCKVEMKTPPNCYITINKEQFLAISTKLGLPNRYDLMKPEAGFDPDTYFFMDDINYILLNIFDLQQDEVISFYGSCRGSTI